jgi:glucose-1-phosphate adenylyltransferase
MPEARVRDSIVSEGCYLAGCEIDGSVVGVRMAVREGSRITRSVLLGADFYEYGTPPQHQPGLGLGRNVILDRVIIDKNARIGDDVRLVNEQNLDSADGDSYYIRSGIIVVPKGGVIRPGTVV